MAYKSPFTIHVYDRAFEWQGYASGHVDAFFGLQYNGQSVGDFTLPSDAPICSVLRNEGSRVRVIYRGEQILSGPIRNPEGDFHQNGYITFPVEDDWRWLPNTVGWVMPLEGVRSTGRLIPTGYDDDAQSFNTEVTGIGTARGSEYMPWPDGSAAFGGRTVSTAEATIKYLLEVNFQRLGRPVNIYPDQGRGGNARAAGMQPDVRFDALDVALEDLLEWSGLGLRLWHDGTRAAINVEVYPSQTIDQALTVESGIIRPTGKWQQLYPDMTRAVVGGPGEGTARDFYGVNGPGAAYEAAHGDIIERFIDATGFRMEWPDTAELAERFRVAKYYRYRRPPQVSNLQRYYNREANKAFREAKPQSGVRLELAETESFYFAGPSGFNLGDRVNVSSAGVAFLDRITEADLEFNLSSGVVVTPRIGRLITASESIAQQTRRLIRAQTRIATGR